MTKHIFLLLCAALLPASGCFGHDVDLELGHCTSPGFAFPTPAITPPLAVGSALTVFTTRTNASGQVTETYTVQSTDPNVLLVTTEEPDTASVFAIADGTATLIVTRSDATEVGRAEATVMTPTSHTLFSRRDLLAGGTLETARVTTPRIVRNEEASFFVRAFAGDTELQLEGSLLLIDDAHGEVTRAPLSVARIEVTTSELGTHDVATEVTSGALALPGHALVVVPVEGVEASVVRSLTLHTDEDASTTSGACASLVSVARDEEGRMIEGAEPVFTDADTEAVLGTGAGLFYHFAPSDALTTRARLGDATATATIHAKLDDVRAGDVSSCSVGGGESAATWTIATLAITLMLARRRRATRA